MSGRAWLVQMDSEGACSEVLERAEVTWPAVNRFLDDIAPGDRVVMWVSGSGYRAGVFGLGIVDGALEERPHKANYGDGGEDDRWVLRASMPVRYTAIFERPVVTRDQLRPLAEFEDFPLFKFAKGANPRALTNAQWDRIVSEIAASVPAAEGA